EGSTRYTRAGHGQPLVLLHGLGMKASIWAPQVAALQGDYDVITPDMLGHGGSSLPPADPKLADYADQLLSLLDALRIASA
ncbi:alpha/beta fold hydrolase, partial [Acinetobacter baumannii]